MSAHHRVLLRRAGGARCSGWAVGATRGHEAVAGALITWLIIRQVSYHLADPERASLVNPLTALVGGVVFLALADYVTAVSDPGQFVLVFNVAVIATGASVLARVFGAGVRERTTRTPR